MSDTTKPTEIPVGLKRPTPYLDELYSLEKRLKDEYDTYTSPKPKPSYKLEIIIAVSIAAIMLLTIAFWH